MGLVTCRLTQIRKRTSKYSLAVRKQYIETFYIFQTAFTVSSVPLTLFQILGHFFKFSITFSNYQTLFHILDHFFKFWCTFSNTQSLFSNSRTLFQIFGHFSKVQSLFTFPEVVFKNPTSFFNFSYTSFKYLITVFTFSGTF